MAIQPLAVRFDDDTGFDASSLISIVTETVPITLNTAFQEFHWQILGGVLNTADSISGATSLVTSCAFRSIEPSLISCTFRHP